MIKRIEFVEDWEGRISVVDHCFILESLKTSYQRAPEWQTHFNKDYYTN